MNQIDTTELKTRFLEYMALLGITPNAGGFITCQNPDHEDRHPSAHVTPNGTAAHCFACHCTFDSIQVEQWRTGADFPTAARSVARLLGVNLGEREAQPTTSHLDKTAPMVHLSGVALLYPRVGRRWTGYVEGNRIDTTFSESTETRFGFQWADSDLIVNHLGKALTMENRYHDPEWPDRPLWFSPTTTSERKLIVITAPGDMPTYFTPDLDEEGQYNENESDHRRCLFFSSWTLSPDFDEDRISNLIIRTLTLTDHEIIQNMEFREGLEVNSAFLKARRKAIAAPWTGSKSG